MSPRPTVVITDFIDDDLAPEREIIGDLAEVVALNATTQEALHGRIEQADALMMYHFLKMDRDTLARLERCRLIVRCGVGYDNVDLAASRELSIPVANIPDYGTEEVADDALGLMLCLLRNICVLNDGLKDPAQTWHYDWAPRMRRLRGRVCGVIGCGRIGSAFALRAKALGMTVQFYDPFVPDGYDKAIGVRRVESVQELIESSHVVSLHTPLTETTRHMINTQSLKWFQRDAVLVNTSRGGVVDQLAVLEALEQGWLQAAALDVLTQEPPAADDPLVAAWRDPSNPVSRRLILNPHSAFHSVEGLHDMRTKGATNIARVLRGESPRNVVNGVSV